MTGGCTVGYDGLIGVTNVGLSLAVLAMLLYYLKVRNTLDELSRRFLFAGFFLGVHELTFFLKNNLVYELTKTLFFITLFYALVFVIRHNVTLTEKLDEQEKFNQELKNRLDELKEEIVAK